MAVPTLIKETYRMVNPGAPLPFPPGPGKQGPVGLLCPVCDTPMIYSRANTDSWLIGASEALQFIDLMITYAFQITSQCPTPANNHNWKTWRCDQLNHELALINLGAPRPIISKEGDWGPRISPSGQVLTPAPERNPGHPYHPFLNCLGTPANTPNGRAPSLGFVINLTVGIPCLLTDCLSQYCLGCCLQYGTPLCRKHPRPTRSSTPLDIPDPLVNRMAHSSVHALNEPTPRGKSKGTASQARHHQWAQTSNSLGRRVPQEAMAMFQNHREQRDEAAQRQAASLIDESKLVMIELWLNEVKPKTITVLFPFWPKACFGESPLLVQALQSANGPNWNRAIIFWDEKITAWRDTLDSYPHCFSAHQRTIVVRLPSVEVPLSALPSSTKASPSKSPVSAFISSMELPPICDLPSSPRTGSESTSTGRLTRAGTEPTQNANTKAELQAQPTTTTGLDSIQSQTTPVPSLSISQEGAPPATPPNAIMIDLTDSPDQVHNEIDTQASKPQLLKLVHSFTKSSTEWLNFTINDAYSLFEHRYAYFKSCVIVNQNGLHGISLKIAAKRDESELQENRPYRLDGPVGVWGPDDRPMLFEDFPNTIEIDDAEVRPQCMVNKVLAQGLGQIVEWSTRQTCGAPVEVIKVMHRCWNSTVSDNKSSYSSSFPNSSVYIYDTLLFPSITANSAC
ncbi:uncharacterized protein MELLADRAFT_62657 [Melampsora larici-populina 98AG31]|uniref:Uncharacterized protein n=1 Tax=Melampsora larici-populina (strain 98AG31 / pathotype 3-4-7) TaxID=747676 RepID=F4RJQ6_MELLP|nr:uncharacterized protein MELLADRAFT_62657 [Melampsora larici-populina 98AG31]EGG07454.1 hypothetical protein MELLADRAFT_62657 [Melampsora larici-populina 98AG31]